MENTESVIEYKISSHCETRYAERIMGRDNATDINRFISEHKEKIKADIHKMIEFGDIIYRGKQSRKDGKGNVLDVVLKDCWVVLVDNESRNVVTLYKIDLGLDDEFNKAYISKMMEKLNEKKEELEKVKLQNYNELNMYTEMINDAEAQIKEYRSMIKNLEGLCEGYKMVIDNNHIKVTQANRNVAEVLNTLINKKEF